MSGLRRNHKLYHLTPKEEKAASKVAEKQHKRFILKKIFDPWKEVTQLSLAQRSSNYTRAFGNWNLSCPKY